MCIFTFLFSTLVADVQESFLVFFISVFLKEKTKSELMFNRQGRQFLPKVLLGDGGHNLLHLCAGLLPPGALGLVQHQDEACVLCPRKFRACSVSPLHYHRAATGILLSSCRMGRPSCSGWSRSRAWLGDDLTMIFFSIAASFVKISF